MNKKIVTNNFKQAFKCKKCPKQAGETGCPLWWEILYTNVNTGEESLRCGCGFVLLPLMLVENMKSANHAAEASYRIREDMITALEHGIRKMLPLIADTRKKQLTE